MLHNPLVQSLEAVAASRMFPCTAGTQARHPGVGTCSFSFSVLRDDNQLSNHCTLVGGSCCPVPSSSVLLSTPSGYFTALVQVSVPYNQSPSPVRPTLCSAPPPSPKKASWKTNQFAALLMHKAMAMGRGGGVVDWGR